MTRVGTCFQFALIEGGVSSAINHALIAATGKEYNLIGNLTNGVLQWYSKNIGNPLVKMEDFIAKFVTGFGNGITELYYNYSDEFFVD